VQPALFVDWPAKRYLGRRYRRNDQSWQAGIHEAGHGVTAHLLEIPFTRVTIRPALGGIAGHVLLNLDEYLSDGSMIPINRRLNAVAMVLVAGSVTQEALGFMPNLRTLAPGSDYDKLDKLLIGEQAGKDAAIAIFEKGVRDLLASPGVGLMVYQLALALTKRITLDHDEAVRAMKGELL